MVLQLRLGLGHWVIPQHLHHDRHYLLSHSGSARPLPISRLSRGLRLPLNRWRLDTWKAARQTVQGPANRELHLERDQSIHKCRADGEREGLLECDGGSLEE